MKNLCVVIATCILLVSCTQNPKETKEAAAPPSADSLKNAFLPLYNGVWAMSDYIDAITRTRSPYQSRNHLEGVVALIIGTETEGDSLLIDASWNNHEGFSFFVHFTPGRQPHSLPTSIPDFDTPDNTYELGYENKSADTVLALYHFDAAGALLDKRLFTKIRNYQPENDIAWGLQYVVNERLIAGNYSLVKGATTPANISFTPEGEVSGLANYSTYRVTTDFIDAFQNSADYICFYDGEDQVRGDCFVFEIQDNKLNLYESVPDPETEIEEKGKLAYVLVGEQ